MKIILSLLLFTINCFSQETVELNFSRDTRLKKLPDNSSDVTKIYQKGVKAIALDYNIDNDFIKVNINDTIGYIKSYWAVQDSKTLDYVNSFKIKRKQLQDKTIMEFEQKTQKEQAEKDLKYIKKFGVKIYDKLKNHYYWIGMTKEMAEISLGEPKDINRTVTSSSIQEQWVYKDIYLYFENGILTTFQD